MRATLPNRNRTAEELALVLLWSPSAVYSTRSSRLPSDRSGPVSGRGTHASAAARSSETSPQPASPLRILYGAAALPDWQLFARIVDFLLRARGPEEVVHRAAASLGLLPHVAWTDLDGRPGEDPCSLSLFLGADERQPAAEPRWLEVRLVDPPPQEAFAQVTSLLGIVEQVLLRERDAERLAGAAYTDPLTLLWNRRGFEPLFDQALTRAERHGEQLALLVCDIDHFKTINDHYGHAAGDRALRCVADVIRSVIRPSDVGVRLGGDELAVLLSGASAPGAAAVAQRIAAALVSVNPLASRALTLSIGIADSSLLPEISSDDRQQTAARFFAAADEALYLSKTAGRNQATVHPRCREAQDG
ncbi:MAG: GGDEF domain-containing protein [Myxococcales bacterium FL481]|nr:MAG: GGDEF domain-containing protein [Myxococcales bacterium FL481]